MKVHRSVSVARWLSAVLSFVVVNACGAVPEGEELPPEAEAAEQQVRMAPDPYADEVVQGGIILVGSPESAIGPPDGNTANFLGLLGGSLLLDMGAGEEGNGPLRIYYRGLSLSVVAEVEFLRADMGVITATQVSLIDLGLGIHSAMVPYHRGVPYRYVRLRSALLSLYQVDAIEATSLANSAVCGDGQVGTGEQCDDANRAAGDGCSPLCVIEPGYQCQGQPSQCVDVNECTNGTAQCSPNANCTNTPGSYTCTCRPGYWGDGRTCTDIDECANGTANCPPGTQCVNTPGSYQCSPVSCPPPTTRCGQVCVDTSCDANNCGGCGNVCGPGQTCTGGVCSGGGGHGKLQITAMWGRNGDADLVVRTPTGKFIYYDNRGPGPSTDYGELDQDASSGLGPENIIWREGYIPPTGVYDICLKAANFSPPPSAANPLNYTVTVKRFSLPDRVFTGVITCPDVGAECHPNHPAYIGSVGYPNALEE
ncbi:EGF domain-containing protein [Myxococcus stipitatus]|nr:EGF domain-containing protein [Myxococcus stipitatus]